MALAATIMWHRQGHSGGGQSGGTAVRRSNL